MSSLNSLYVKTETLETLCETLKKKGEKGIELTIPISDEGNKYGQNVSAYVAQSKEDRESKKERFYIGNGNTFWTDGTIKVVKREQSNAETSASQSTDVPTQEANDELPF